MSSVAEKQILTLDLLKRLPEIQGDVRASAQRGGVRAIVDDIVLADGTEAEQLVTGLCAVRRQLREDIIPEVLSSGPKVASQLSSRLRDLPQAVSEAATAAATASPPTQAGLEETIKAVREELPNVFRRTPEGLFTPPFSVERKAKEYEVRRYESYAVASTDMGTGMDMDTTGVEGSEAATLSSSITDPAASGQGFNTLAGYLFGDNEESKSMSMTMPVVIDSSPEGDRSMSFVMPEGVSAAGAPAPSDSKVSVRDVPGETLAVREFPGFATDGEVQRQLAKLLASLERDNLDAEAMWVVDDPATYRVLQYNPPYTLAWLRRNEVAVRVSRAAAPAAAQDPAAADPVADDPAVVSA